MAETERQLEAALARGVVDQRLIDLQDARNRKRFVELRDVGRRAGVALLSAVDAAALLGREFGEGVKPLVERGARIDTELQRRG